MKCTTIGTYFRNVRRVCFPQHDAPLRTDWGFRSQQDKLHHRVVSPLEYVGSSDGMQRLDMVRDFSTSDPLHLLHQGVMKYCLRMWTDGTTEYKNKFSTDDKKKIDQAIYQCNKYLSSDINRRIRSLNFIKHFKATEFRSILLYTGLVIFKSVLPKHIYTHFVRLCLATRLVSCRTYVKHANLKGLARLLFSEYFRDFINYYGVESVVSNIHYIIHIMDDVDHLGTLEENSTYPFENHLREIKSRTQASNMPLQQITRRIVELSLDSENNFLKTKYAPKEPVPALKYEIIQANSLLRMFRFIQITKNVFISTRKIGDSWFITRDNKIIQMKYAFVRDSSFFICGNEILNKMNFFDEPFPSHLVDIYLCDPKKNENDSEHELNSIKSKVICIPNENQYVIIPVLHSIDECIEAF